MVIGWVAVWLMGVDLMDGSLSLLAAIGWGISGAILTFVVISGLSRLPGPARDSLAAHTRQLHQFACDYRWSVLVALSALAGIGEELLFRGAVQGWLGWHMDEWFAVAIASILFGLVHFLSVAYFLMAATLGVALGITYVLTDSLILIMVWHGVYDMIALYVLRRFPGLFGVS